MPHGLNGGSSTFHHMVTVIKLYGWVLWVSPRTEGDSVVNQSRIAY